MPVGEPIVAGRCLSWQTSVISASGQMQKWPWPIIECTWNCTVERSTKMPAAMKAAGIEVTYVQLSNGKRLERCTTNTATRTAGTGTARRASSAPGRSVDEVEGEDFTDLHKVRRWS